MISTDKILKVLHSHGFRAKNVVAANIFNHAVDEVIATLGDKTKEKMIDKVKKIKKIHHENPYEYYDLAQQAIKKNFGDLGTNMILDAIKNSLEKKIGYFGCDSIEEILEIISTDEISEILQKNNSKILCLESNKQAKIPLEPSKIERVDISEIDRGYLERIADIESIIIIQKPLCLLQKSN